MSARDKEVYQQATDWAGKGIVIVMCIWFVMTILVQFFE